MMSSKTTKLLSALERYKYQKKNIVVFKPRIDTRYSADQVVSHSGWTSKALVVDSGAHMLEVLQQFSEMPDVVAVDEMFMIDGAGEILVWLYRQMGITVVTATLDLSFSGEPFAEVVSVLPWATHVEKCSAVCLVCGADAYYTHRKEDDNDLIKIGGSEAYEPRCFKHFPHIAKNK